jgi:hypothetical protein
MIMTSMACVIASGIYLASHLPRTASMGPVTVLLALAAVAWLAAAGTTGRIPDFNWSVFKRVISWASLAYLVITGMLEFIFVYDHVRGSMLTVLTLSLVIFFLDVPLLLAFSVARYQERN